MSIEAKHAYRFGYLKSEEWQYIRKMALAKAESKCFLCGVPNWSNDVHHKRYSKNGFWATKPTDVAVLCRECHTIVHEFFGDEKDNGKIFCKLRYGIIQTVFKFDKITHARLPSKVNPGYCFTCGRKNISTMRHIGKHSGYIPLCDDCWELVLKMLKPNPSECNYWRAMIRVRRYQGPLHVAFGFACKAYFQANRTRTVKWWTWFFANCYERKEIY